MFLRPVYHIIIVVVCCLCFSLGYGQSVVEDTIKLNRSQAEKLFLEQNLYLLAEKLNIDQAEALIIQAKVWPNPHLEIDQINFWSTTAEEAVPPLIGGRFGKNQQFAAQLDQLIYTAGKRKKNIALQSANKELAMHQFKETLLILRTEFRNLLSELYANQKKQTAVSVQLAIIKNMIKAQDTQFKNGNIAKSEYYRIKALGFTLQSSLNEIIQDGNQIRKEVKTLMNLKPAAYPFLIEELSDVAVSFKPLTASSDSLFNLANENNPGILAANSGVRVNEANYRLERARRVPDLALRAAYDRNGNAMLNFVGFGVVMDLPVFDRNKGNIMYAKAGVKQSEYMYQYKQNDIYNDLIRATQDYSKQLLLFESIDLNYINELDQLLLGISKNFERKNMNIVEFMNFFEAFQENKNLYYSTIKDLMIKKEELNFLTGTEL